MINPKPLKGKVCESLQKGEPSCFYYPDVAAAVEYLKASLYGLEWLSNPQLYTIESKIDEAFVDVVK